MSDTSIQQVTASATGISNTGKFPQIQLFPNPASDVLKVEGLPQDAQISVLDVAGKKLSVRAEWQVNGWVISTAALPSGIYTLRMETKTCVGTRIFRKS